MSVKRRSTEDLVAELREFHHTEAADRLERVQKTMDELDPRKWATDEEKQAGLDRLVALAGLARDVFAPSA